MVTLPLTQLQETITIYPPITSRRSFIIYTRSTTVSDHKDLSLQKGDKICVSFSTNSVEETLGMIQSLFDGKVVVKAIADLPLIQVTDSKTDETEFRIKTADAFTCDDDSDSNDDEIKTKKRKKN